MTGCAAPQFVPALQRELLELMRWRRDVRRFRPDPIGDDDRNALLEAVALAPSVGLSEPWRIVRVVSPEALAAVQANFAAANADALATFAGERADTYARLKLAGLSEAPEQWAVFADMSADKGGGLGRATMPEMAAYSVVAAVMQMWLVARVRGLGLGWVSILDAHSLGRTLSVPADWRLVAYLCIGWPEAEDDTPELERAGWERRATALPPLLER